LAVYYNAPVARIHFLAVLRSGAASSSDSGKHKQDSSLLIFFMVHYNEDRGDASELRIMGLVMWSTLNNFNPASSVYYSGKRLELPIQSHGMLSLN
jgi:hypothetical protein